MNKKQHIVIGPDFRVRFVERVSGQDTVLLSHEELLEKLPEFIRTNPAAEAVQAIVFAVLAKLGTVKIPMQGTGTLCINLEEVGILGTIQQEETKRALLSGSKDWGISTRVTNCLRPAGIEYAYQIAIFENNDLLRFINFGKTSVSEIEKWFGEHNISGEIIKKLKEKDKELGSTVVSSIEVFKNHPAYQEFSAILAPVADLAGKTMIDFYKLYYEMFPHRHKEYKGTLTIHEQKFKDKAERDRIKALFDDLRQVLNEFTHLEFKKFIEMGGIF